MNGTKQISDKSVSKTQIPVKNQTSISAKLIDVDFAVTPISALSHAERSAFKPVYSMNKWWARRSSTVFRAILLSLALSPEDNLMDAYYLNHQDNPDIKNKIVLDPFMGGGTTIVEGLRLGYKAIGIDLNPLSWFIVKTETSRVDLKGLELAFERLEAKVSTTIKELYSTNCPCCSQKAETVYTFWAKEAVCAQEDCNTKTLLFRNYIIGQRRGNSEIKYYEVACPKCRTAFHCEIDHADMVHKNKTVSTELNPCVYASKSGLINCPCCSEKILIDSNEHQLKIKKISLYSLLCPNCNEIYSHRGEVSEKTECPHCSHNYNPHQGNHERGKYICPRGHKNSIIEAVTANKGEPLNVVPFAIEGYCPYCAARNNASDNLPLFEVACKENLGRNPKGTLQKGCSNCRTVNFKFFKRPDTEDLKIYEQADKTWAAVRKVSFYPRGEIQDYEKTNRLIIHNYKFWEQLFNPRQLIALSLMLENILKEPKPEVRESLLAAFLGTLEHQNMLNIYHVPYAQSAGAFGRHDFHPKITACEGNPWGGKKGRGTFLMVYKSIVTGKDYLHNPFDAKIENGLKTNVYTKDGYNGITTDSFEALQNSKANLILKAQDSTNLEFIPDDSVDYVVTDPPYADAVQYAELSDFFYVWLREALKGFYPKLLQSAEAPKQAEIVENKSRKKSRESFYEGLGKVFKECRRVLKKDGRLVFTFHHSKEAQWANLLETLLNNGFELIATYPVKSEATESGNLVFHSNSKSSIAYDIIHVCRKNQKKAASKDKIYWRDLLLDIEKRVKIHIQSIQAGKENGYRMGKSDAQVILWGECMAIYSQNYGNIWNEEEEPVSIRTALNTTGTLIEKVLEQKLLLHSI